MTGSSAPARSIGAPGVALVVAGAVVVLISFTALDWYPGLTGPSAAAHMQFGDLHRLTTGTATVGIASAYFGWLAWVLLILVIALGLAANLPTPATNGLRVAGLAVGLAGAAVTYLALDRLFSRNEGDYPLHHASLGVWFALAGYLIAGAGAALGPMRTQ